MARKRRRNRYRKRAQKEVWALAAFLIVALLVVLVPGLPTAVAIAALIGAFVIGFTSAQRNATRARQWSAVGSFFELTPDGFEKHVAEAYKLAGYETETTPSRGDQGVDVLARRGDESIAIQCKRYSDHASNTAIQEVHAGRTHYGCNKAVAICLGGFTASAVNLAKSTNVQVIDGKQYADFVHRLTPEAERQSHLGLPTGQALLWSIGLVLIAVLGIAVDIGRHAYKTTA